MTISREAAGAGCHTDAKRRVVADFAGAGVMIASRSVARLICINGKNGLNVPVGGCPRHAVA
ncbi:hypothetical protein [Burkholderia sp. BCC0322]|uniref:hypothetical protein n=1 Tax=Burkholderia sp. BCC0322 TaxID=2676296 RepID=UPI001ABAEC0D|nr:hypothetical protein [Burkholderia sp. BCC0322]